MTKHKAGLRARRVANAAVAYWLRNHIWSEREPRVEPDAGGAEMSHKDKTLPDGCGYQGYEFGAAYPDSACFGGRLYDMDDCGAPGTVYEPAEYVPCPICHPRKYVEYLVRRGWSGRAATALTVNIRRNRQNGTEPWKMPEVRPDA